MLRKQTSILGIELHDREIRVMEVRYRANVPNVVKIGVEPMPLGAMEWGTIQNAVAIAMVLRKILDRMGTNKAVPAVLGVPSSNCVLRNLMVPPVPEADLPAIVAGEVDHYGIVRTAGGVHTFLSLSPPSRGAANDSMPVAVFAVEDDVTSKLREVAERAGLEVEAVEPTLYAMYRTTMASAATPTTVLSLMMGSTCSDMAVVSDGQLIAYRRVDTGSALLLQWTGEEGVKPTLDLMAAEALATETRRTLEYLQREYPDFPVVESVRLSIDDPSLDSLAEYLAQRLGLSVQLVQPHAGPNATPEVVAEMAGPAGLRFSAVSGLCLRSAPKSFARVPRLDLFSAERSVAKQAMSKRNLVGSVAVSLIAILMGGVGTQMYNTQLAQIDAETRVSGEKLQEIRNSISATQQARALKEEQYKILRKDGVPIGPLADSLVSSLAPGVGLSTFTVSADLNVSITAEAADEARMIKTVQTLQRSPVLKELMIKSFNRAPGGIQFQVSAHTISMAKIKQPSDVVASR